MCDLSEIAETLEAQGAERLGQLKPACGDQ
jgi:hypothetical protein